MLIVGMNMGTPTVWKNVGEAHTEEAGVQRPEEYSGLE